MSTALKYTCFAALVLFAVVLTAVCGQLACESFVHACCGRVDRAEGNQSRAATALRQVLAAPSSGFSVASIARACGVPAPLSASSRGSVPLRA